ncbi:MAG TPA: hypothetical protein VEK84_12155 [Terriglobales bacterium]|nr:hypothetical protein [Terriglobales bacterium]
MPALRSRRDYSGGDIANLLTEVNRLYRALLEARIQSANRLAAIRAALSAYSDGEPDPLAYLRDELGDNHVGPVTGWCG